MLTSPYRMCHFFQHKIIPFYIIVFLQLSCLHTQEVISQSDITGIWENAHRFIAFSPTLATPSTSLPQAEAQVTQQTGTVRFVLKPYYAFYYDDISSYQYRYVPHSLEIMYPQENTYSVIPVFIHHDTTAGGKSLFTQFLQNDTPHQNTHSIEGFWRCAGNVAAISITPPQYFDEVHSYYITSDTVFRIRYWQVDASYDKTIRAEIKDTTADGKAVYTFDKFIQIADIVYTCVAGRNTQVRNIEAFSYKIENGILLLTKRMSSVTDTQNTIRMPITLSPDGVFLSLSDSYLTQSRTSNLDGEIEAHNALRRPPRKAPFEFMELDFHWDEIEKLRNP